MIGPWVFAAAVLLVVAWFLTLGIGVYWFRKQRRMFWGEELRVRLKRDTVDRLERAVRGRE